MTDVNKAVVILSGGLDSSTLLHCVVKSLKVPVVATLSFYYGQTHAKELASAAKISADLGIANFRIDLSPVMKDFKSALTGKEDIPEGHYAQENMKKTIVPNRNSIMLSIAVGYAISLEAGRVFYGAHAGDHAIYPDCRPEFFEAFKKAEEIGNAWTPVILQAPFMNITKADIVKIGLELGVPFQDTWSCYRGKDKACGTCGTCQERLASFRDADAEDPLEYVDRTSWIDTERKWNETHVN